MPVSITDLLDLEWAIDPTALAPVFARFEALAPETLALAQSQSTEPTKPYKVESGVAIVPLKGVMMSGMGWLTWLLDGTDTDAFAASMTAAADDPDAKSVFLDIDSPGGMVKGCIEAAQAIQYAAKKKPVHGYVGDACYSAALFVGSQAKTLHGDQLSGVGSIGVFRPVRDSSKAFEREGVKVHMVSSGPLKGAGTPGTEVTAEQLAEFQHHVNAASDVFQSFLASGRKMKAADVTALADGRSWTGKEAVSKGLLDGLASRVAVMDALRAYVPGRKAVHIAAQSAIGEKTMSRMDSFLAWLKGEGEGAEEKPQDKDQASGPLVQKPDTELRQIAAPTFVGDTAIRKELDEIKAEQKRQLDALVDKQKADNRIACEAWMKRGMFPASDLEKNVERRAQNPALFDEMMGERRVNPLSASAIEGDKAVAALDPTEHATMLTAICDYYKTAGVAAKGA